VLTDLHPEDSSELQGFDIDDSAINIILVLFILLLLLLNFTKQGVTATASNQESKMLRKATAFPPGGLLTTAVIDSWILHFYYCLCAIYAAV